MSSPRTFPAPLALPGLVAAMAAVIAAGSGGPAGAAFAQIAPRPSSRALPYPTAPPLQPPPPLRFGVAWEREMPGERIRHLIATGEVVIALLSDGTLRAHAADSGESAWIAGGCDASLEPFLTGDSVSCRAPGGSLLAFDVPTGARRDPTPRIDPLESPGPFRPSRRPDASARLHPVAPVFLGAPRTRREAAARRREIARLERLIAVAVKPGILELRRVPSGRRTWRRRMGTEVLAAPVAVRTVPGEPSRRRPETLLVATTADGVLAAMRPSSGRLAWTARAAGRIRRPLAVWLDSNDPGPDGIRLLAAAEGSRRLEAFRAADGAAAGEMVFEPSTAVVLAGPVCGASKGAGSPSPPRCYVAWSPWAPSGSRLTALRPSSRPARPVGETPRSGS